MENFSGTDIVIVAVLAVSALLSAYRGFIAEMLGIGSWMLAAVFGFYAMAPLYPFVSGYLKNPVLANIASFSVTALLSLILLTLFCSKVTGKIRKSVLNRLDHFLGFIFGVVRGIVLLVLVYFLIMTLAPKTLNELEKKSQTFPYLERVTESVKEHLPESLFDNPTKRQEEPDELEELIEKINKTAHKKPASKKADKKKSEKQAEEKPVDPATLFDDLNSPKVKEKETDKSKEGYNKKEREELDRLFMENVGESDSVVP